MKGYNKMIDSEYTVSIVKKQDLRDMILKNIFISQSDLKSFYTRCPNDINNNIDNLYLTAIESNPVIINVNKDNKIELIDGFLRLLFLNPKDNSDILVKTYKNLTDAQYIKELCICNSWKENNCSKTIDFFDRGFLFSLLVRFNVDIIKYLNESLIDILKLFSEYCINKKLFSSLRDNSFAIEDLKELLDLTLPCNIDNFNLNKDEKYTCSYHYKEILFISSKIICDIRNSFRIENQRSFSKDMFLDLINTPEVLKVCKKMSQITVKGRVDNRIEQLKSFIIVYLYNKLIPNDNLDEEELKKKYLKLIHINKNSEANEHILSYIKQIKELEGMYPKSTISTLYREWLENSNMFSFMRIGDKNNNLRNETITTANHIYCYLSTNNCITENDNKFIDRLTKPVPVEVVF